MAAVSGSWHIMAVLPLICSYDSLWVLRRSFNMLLHITSLICALVVTLNSAKVDMLSVPRVQMDSPYKFNIKGKERTLNGLNCKLQISFESRPCLDKVFLGF